MFLQLLYYFFYSMRRLLLVTVNLSCISPNHYMKENHLLCKCNQNGDITLLRGEYAKHHPRTYVPNCGFVLQIGMPSVYFVYSNAKII